MPVAPPMLPVETMNHAFSNIALAPPAAPTAALAHPPPVASGTSEVDDAVSGYSGRDSGEEIEGAVEREGDEARCVSSEKRMRRLLRAAQRGDEAVLTEWLAGNGHVDQAVDDVEGTLLIAAAFWDQKRLVDMLLRQGASVNAQDNHSYTALIVATSYGHKGVIDMLIRHGAEVNHRGKDGKTALWIATENNDTDTVLHLLEAGAETKVRDLDGVTMLQMAKEKQHSECIDAFRKHIAAQAARRKAAAVHVENDDHQALAALLPSLRSAVPWRVYAEAWRRRVDEARTAGSPPPEHPLGTLLEKCCRAGKFSCAKVLLAAGVPADAIVWSGGFDDVWSPLHECVQPGVGRDIFGLSDILRGHYLCAELLLRHGASLDVDVGAGYGGTPVEQARSTLEVYVEDGVPSTNLQRLLAMLESEPKRRADAAKRAKLRLVSCAARWKVLSMRAALRVAARRREAAANGEALLGVPCLGCGEAGVFLWACSECRLRQFCSRRCLKKAWPAHESVCLQRRADREWCRREARRNDRRVEKARHAASAAAGAAEVRGG